MMQPKKTYIIAEAGVNHDGQVGIARALIDIAVEAGADAVKFQLFEPDKLVTQSAPKAAYQKENLGDETGSQHSMLEKLALSPEAMVELSHYCQERGIDFLCTPFDVESLEFLVAHTSMRALKLGSGDLTFAPLLAAAAHSGLPVILSTGMAEMAEIAQAIAAMQQVDESVRQRLTLLHCVSQYPAPVHAMNLRAMEVMRSEFGVEIGLSDHSLGLAMAIAAVALGASVIEKHFTHDVNAHGPDHAASLSAAGLKAMVQAIREVEQGLGSAVKTCQPEEINTKEVARRSVVAVEKLEKGAAFTSKNIACLRPGTGPVSPFSYAGLLGKAALQDYAAGDFLHLDEVAQP